MSVSKRSGVERTVFQDAKSGRTIWRLTNSDQEDKHTYYDICPWSPDRKHIVFSSARAEDLTLQYHDTLCTNKGKVYLMDTKDYGISLLADQAFFHTHTGTFAMWHPNGSKLYFYQTPDSVGVIDMATRKLERVMQGTMRQLSPDGAIFASESNDPGYREGRGIYTMNEDGSETHRIVSTEELYDITPNKKEFSVADMTVGNTKWTPDGKHMLVAMWIYPTPKVRRSIYVVSRDGRDKRWLTHFGHHHSWTPDGKQVLFCGWKKYTSDGVREDPRLFLINFDGTDRRVVIEEPLGGHPLMDPSSRMIVTWDDDSIILVKVKEQQIERPAFLLPRFNQSHTGTHPHPVWSADGKMILYNSAQTGHSQVYLLPM